MLFNAQNFAKATVLQGYLAGDTNIALVAGQGARFGATPFNAVWWNSTDYPDPSDDPLVEIVRVTENLSDDFTIIRAQEGTTATNKNIAGKVYKIIAGLTAIQWNKFSTLFQTANTNQVVYVNSSGDPTGGNMVTGETVSGNGTSFTLAYTPVTGTLAIYANGQRLSVATGDYTVSGKNINTANSWSTGNILADYIY